jgi:hypothetical protein
LSRRLEQIVKLAVGGAGGLGEKPRFVSATPRKNDAVASGNPQVDDLLELLNACHRILPELDDEDRLAPLLREVCEAVEARVSELSRPLSELAETEAG